jgi:hypothetical protein
MSRSSFYLLSLLNTSLLYYYYSPAINTVIYIIITVLPSAALYSEYRELNLVMYS